MDKELSIVESIFIGIEDHGILTITLHLTGAETSWGQSYGAYSYGSVSMEDKWAIGGKQRGGLAFSRTVIALCRGFGVDNILDIKGKMCWAIRERPFSFIDAVQPIGLDKPIISLKEISEMTP